MRPLWKDILIALFLGMVLPAVVVQTAIRLDHRDRGEVGHMLMPTDTVEPIPEVKLTMLLKQADGTVAETDLDEYLLSVVLAEMPASFEKEALKAQAVVARTYTLKALQTGGKHGDGSVCRDSTCCQAYISLEDYRAGGGREEDIEKVRAAVLETSGYVLTYEGGLIEATYFSCSGGSTEDAVAVWGTDLPYLRATASPGEEGAAHFTDTVYLSKKQVEDALGVTLSSDHERWVGYATYTAGGGINTMQIGGKEFKGTELRKLLGLRSTAFTVSADSEGITVVTRGFGHRVGMSQYGADAMAASGSSYEEILAYYYKDTTLERYMSAGD